MVHDVIPTNSTIVDYDIPCPQCYGVPLLHEGINCVSAVHERVNTDSRQGKTVKTDLLDLKPLSTFLASSSLSLCNL